MSVAARFLELVGSDALDLPHPGSGRTAERHERLAAIARVDVSVARLAEAHADALAILHDGGREPRLGAYGVWAAEDPRQPLRLLDDPDGPRLEGTKTFCSGLGIVERALVTAHVPGGRVLVDVECIPSPTVTLDPSGWVAPGFAGTNTGRVSFRGHRVGADAVVGEIDWYLDRPGFWHGACGPAACWAGGAQGLVAIVERHLAGSSTDAVRAVQVGAMAALAWDLDALLAHAGAEIDADPTDVARAHRGALALRHRVERAATELVDLTGRTLGPRAFTFDADLARRINEVQIYVRQCHAERDLAALGHLRLAPPAP